MTIVGNLLIALATLLYFSLVSALFGKEPPRGGDAVVGYVWGIIIMGIAFSVCMGIVTLIIGGKGNFEWVSTGRSSRFFLVAGGFFATTITTVLCSLFKQENGPVPVVLKFLSDFVPILVPLVLIVTAIILLNNNLRMNVPAAVYKWPLLAVSVIGVAGIFSAAAGFIASEHRNQQAVIAGMIRDQDNNHQRMLSEIDTCDVMKNMVFILVFTDANQDVDVKEKAVAKIKTNRKWQQELVARLKSDWAPEAFNFLASNAVDDPQLFTEPVKEGVLVQARLVRETIRRSSHPSHFYAGQFSWEVERVLRTVDRFNNQGTDYRSAVRALRAALDEPSEFKKPAFECTGLLNEWIKKHP